MICDKCKKKCTDNWIPGVDYPKYTIEETIGLGDIFKINLCYYCSQRFKNWLDEKPEPCDVEKCKTKEYIIPMTADDMEPMKHFRGLDE
jgi:hypothetical protein